MNPELPPVESHQLLRNITVFRRSNSDLPHPDSPKSFESARSLIVRSCHEAAASPSAHESALPQMRFVGYVPICPQLVLESRFYQIARLFF